MRRMYVLLSAVTAMLLLLIACGEISPSPFRVYCRVDGAGSDSAVWDTSLQVGSLGKAFYLTDDMVFHLGEELTRHSLLTGLSTPISPVGMQISDKQYLAIDRANQMLYFAADDAIYKVDFDGGACTKLSPDAEGEYSAPALSPDGQYLTAIHDGHIARLNLSSGEWYELCEPDDAIYAMYAADQDAYYYFTLTYSPGYYNLCFQLFKQDAQSQTPIRLMMDIQYYSDYLPFNVDARISPDGNYLAMQFTQEPIDTGGYLSGPVWHRYPSNLNIYERSSGAVTLIEDCFAYSFVPDTGELLYSHLKYGMADLIRMDMHNRNTFMVWDGYHEKDYYSYSVTEIFPRDDGQKIHLNAWERSRINIPNPGPSYNYPY